MTVNESMKDNKPIIQLTNTEEVGEDPPLYRLLVQTSDELPAPDLGLESIKYSPEAIEAGLKGLVGGFVYDGTQSEHNRKRNPKQRSRKVAKIVSKGFNPDYGGYVDIEPFNTEFQVTLEQALDNQERGLPVLEGPSTELTPVGVEWYDTDKLEVTELRYDGLEWVNKPRDKRAGVCRALNNSLTELIKDKEEDEEMSDLTEHEDKEVEMVKMTKEEFDELQGQLGELETLRTKYSEGESLYVAGKALYEELQKEEASLREQLVPVWTREGENKMEMVNTILEALPETERDAKKSLFEDMTPDQLQVVINALPDEDKAHGIPEQGDTKTGDEKEDKDELSQEEYMKRLGL